MSDPAQPAAAPKPKMSPALRIIVGIVSVVAIVAGIVKIKQGVGQMSGEDSEITRLRKEANEAIDAANKHGLEATPLFQSVLDTVDKDGLAAARTQKKDAAQQAGDLFGKAAEQFRMAATKLDDAVARKPSNLEVTYFAAKSRAYKGFAEARTINREIIGMFLDPSIATIQALEPKILAAAKRRDDIEKVAAESATEGDRIARELKK